MMKASATAITSQTTNVRPIMPDLHSQNGAGSRGLNQYSPTLIGCSSAMRCKRAA